MEKKDIKVGKVYLGNGNQYFIPRKISANNYITTNKYIHKSGIIRGGGTWHIRDIEEVEDQEYWLNKLGGELTQDTLDVGVVYYCGLEARWRLVRKNKEGNFDIWYSEDNSARLSPYQGSLIYTNYRKATKKELEIWYKHFPEVLDTDGDPLEVGKTYRAKSSGDELLVHLLENGYHYYTKKGFRTTSNNCGPHLTWNKLNWTYCKENNAKMNEYLKTKSNEAPKKGIFARISRFLVGEPLT